MYDAASESTLMRNFIFVGLGVLLLGGCFVFPKKSSCDPADYIANTLNASPLDYPHYNEGGCERRNNDISNSLTASFKRKTLEELTQFYPRLRCYNSKAINNNSIRCDYTSLLCSDDADTDKERLASAFNTSAQLMLYWDKEMKVLSVDYGTLQPCNKPMIKFDNSTKNK